MSRPITAAAVLAERSDLAPTGERYCELALTGAIVADVPPHHRREVAAFVTAVLQRPPISRGGLYEPHLAILGALVCDLESLAVRDALDGPAAEPAELRDPELVARERDMIRATRDWADLRRAEATAAYREHVDAMLEASAQAHEAAEHGLDEAAARAAAIVEQLEPPLPGDDDVITWSTS